MEICSFVCDIIGYFLFLGASIAIIWDFFNHVLIANNEWSISSRKKPNEWSIWSIGGTLVSMVCYWLYIIL